MTRFCVALAGAATLLGLPCSNDPRLGVELANQRVPVIDMHLHTGHWDAIPA